jgi:tetratricopeptide (TPR) repeat protein
LPVAPAEQGGDMTDAAAARAEVVAAREARTTATRLLARTDRARTELAAADEALARAQRTLGEEREDVEALESFSPTRIWAGLRGRRDADLDRERAEQQQAEYAVATALARRTAAHDELAGAQAERRDLGDVDARWAAAVAALETALGTGPDAAELAELTQRLAGVRAERSEVAEAQVAADEALQRLGEAQGLLAKAGDWAAWDTWGGGGMWTDMMKYDRMDEAGAVLAQADRALKRLAGELADVGLTGVGGVEVSGWDQTFDVWFDNVFTDWAVAERIRDARRRTDDAVRAVTALRGDLHQRLLGLTGDAQTLAGRQDELAERLAGG